MGGDRPSHVLPDIADQHTGRPKRVGLVHYVNESERAVIQKPQSQFSPSVLGLDFVAKLIEQNRPEILNVVGAFL